MVGINSPSRDNLLWELVESQGTQNDSMDKKEYLLY